MFADLTRGISRKIARYHRSKPFAMRNDAPLVSFTFDDVPESAYTNGARRRRHLLCCRRHLRGLRPQLAGDRTRPGPRPSSTRPRNWLPYPQSKCRVRFGTDWTAYQQNMVERIRRIAPDLPLLLTGGCWSNIEGIVLLDTDLLRDRRNFVSVHFYYPFLFTHQSATWTMPYLAGTIGVPFPASAGSLAETLSLTRERFRSLALAPGADRAAAEAKAEQEISRYFHEAQGPAQIDQWMNQMADWQRREGVASDRIVFTEFGAMKQTIDGVEIDRGSRARWLHDASLAMENRGWGWTAYVLRDDPFGLYAKPGDRYPEPQLLRALRLTVPKDATKS
jgi:hypothetical protein